MSNTGWFQSLNRIGFSVQIVRDADSPQVLVAWRPAGNFGAVAALPTTCRHGLESEQPPDFASDAKSGNKLLHPIAIDTFLRRVVGRS